MIKLFLMALTATVACNYLVDAQVALFIQEVLYGNRYWRKATADIPDLLSVVVLAVALAGWFIYRGRRKRGIHDAVADLALLLGCSVPASYLCKTILKFVFGRINTRQWLIDQSLYGFHWFQGTGAFSGFPSGHMAVFAAFAAVFWRIYPPYRGYYFASLVILGLALVATNYHFVGDVLAGAVAGVMVEVLIYRLLRRQHLLQVS